MQAVVCPGLVRSWLVQGLIEFGAIGEVQHRSQQDGLVAVPVGRWNCDVFVAGLCAAEIQTEMQTARRLKLFLHERFIRCSH